MKRKAIEKIEPAKTRKKGHIATVQTLDDIAIINVFNDKVLAVRYCINCKTGEHEYWTEKNGWKKGKLITAIEGNWYEWVWMKHAYKYPKIDSEEDRKRLLDITQDKYCANDVWSRMLYMHESKDITLHMVRSGDKEFYSWDDALSYCTMITDGEDAEKTWEEVYGEKFPKKEEIAPVQPKKRKESKVVKAKKPERKPIKTERLETKQPDPPTKSEELPTKDEEKPTETPDTTTVPTETKEKEPEKAEETPETKTEFQQENTDETQIPGQTELTKDFPEYCPPNMNPPEQQELPEEVKPAYATRRLYISSVDADTAAEYMGKAMENAIRNMPGVSFGVLTKESFWKEFFETEVDRNGDEIECVN